MFCSRPCPKVDFQVSVANWISLPSISVPRFLSCTPSSCHASLVQMQMQIRYHLASIFSPLRVLYFLLLAEPKCQQVPIACIHIFPFHIRSHSLSPSFLSAYVPLHRLGYSKHSAPAMSSSHPLTVGDADDEDLDDICPVCDGECTCRPKPRPAYPIPTNHASGSAITRAPPAPAHSPPSTMQSLKIKFTAGMLSKARAAQKIKSDDAENPSPFSAQPFFRSASCEWQWIISRIQEKRTPSQRPLCQSRGRFRSRRAHTTGPLSHIQAQRNHIAHKSKTQAQGHQAAQGQRHDREEGQVRRYPRRHSQEKSGHQRR